MGPGEATAKCSPGQAAPGGAFLGEFELTYVSSARSVEQGYREDGGTTPSSQASLHCSSQLPPLLPGTPFWGRGFGGFCRPAKQLVVRLEAPGRKSPRDSFTFFSVSQLVSVGPLYGAAITFPIQTSLTKPFKGYSFLQ